MNLSLFLLVIPEYSRHPWRSRYTPPSAFAFAILQTQSRSDIRDPASFCFNVMQKSLDYAPLLRRALRAIGFADVRFGILPAQSRLRGNDDKGNRSN